MPRKVLVVARHNEPIDWLPPDWEAMIVQKTMQVPNIGREASSYLWAITQLYPDLEDDDLVAFVQGDPSPHVGDLNAALRQPVADFTWIRDVLFECDGNGVPHHGGLDIAGAHERFIGPFPGRVSFAPGAQFIATGALILSLPLESYQEALEWVYVTQDAPWILERLWERFLKSGSGQSRSLAG